MHKLLRISIVTALVFVCVSTAVAAETRKWTTRDGKHTTEAKLIDFDGDKVILKRTDGNVVAVPLDRLSLEDHAYVKKSLASLGFDVPATNAANKPAAPPTATISPSPAPEPSSSPPLPSPSTTAEPTAPAPTAPAPATPPAPAPVSTWKEPPLTTAEGNAWQVHSNPAGINFDIPIDAKISLPLSTYNPAVIYPAAPVPFVCVAAGLTTPYAMYDLRTNRKVGDLGNGVEHMFAKAVSPDGKRMAFTFNQNSEDRSIQVWSFETGKVETSFEPFSPSMRLRILAFAGPDRILAWHEEEKCLLVWDVRTHELVTRIARDSFDLDAYAISPGGVYIAVGKPKQKVIEILDLRNGLLAGKIETKVSSNLLERLESIAFSHDGSELAAVYRPFQAASLHCWDLKTGQQIVCHELKDVPDTHFVVDSPLSWFNDGSGWQVNAAITVDRKSGGPIITEDTKRLESRYPKRYVNGQRMLQVVKTEGRKHLELVPMPTHSSAQVEKFVEKGGDLVDFGLPQLTQVNEKAPRKLVLDSGWTYQPQAVTLPEGFSHVSLPLESESMSLLTLELSRPDVAVAAVGRYDRSLATPERAAKRMGNGVNVYCRYDLVKGKQLSRVEIPYTSRLLDLSLDGKLGAVVIEDKDDRVDVFDLVSGKHVVGFRPYGTRQTGPQPDNKIFWARFAAENVLLTATVQGRLTAWSMPDAKPLYELKAGEQEVAIDSTGQTIAANVAGTVQLIDVATGVSKGILAKPKQMGRGLAPALAFRADGKRLAALYNDFSVTPPTSYVVSWDLTQEGKVLTELKCPLNARAMKWVGPEAILLVGVSKMKEPSKSLWMPALDKFHQSALVDLSQNMVAWTYQHGRGRPGNDSFADLHCFLIAKDDKSPVVLQAVSLPDPEAKAYLEKIKLPGPLIGPGATVAFDVEITGTFPTSTDEKQSKALRLRDEVIKNLDTALAKQEMKQGESGGLRLKVQMKEQSETTSLELGGPYSFSPRRTLRVTTNTVATKIQLVTEAGRVLWSISDSVTPNEISSTAQPPKGMTLDDFRRQQQWEVASKWVRDLKLPFPLYNPDDFEGVGESTFKVNGTTMQRKPKPAPAPKPSSDDKVT